MRSPRYPFLFGFIAVTSVSIIVIYKLTTTVYTNVILFAFLMTIFTDMGRFTLWTLHLGFSQFIPLLCNADNTDYEAVREIVHRVLGEKTQTKKWASNGCHHLRRKLSAQMMALSNEGCNAFIIVHDLDRNPANGSLNDEAKLRTN